jgi:RimJ/RimL family protein N-acetyltransferase
MSRSGAEPGPDAALAAAAFPLIHAVLDALQPGTVWRGGTVASPCAFVATRFGFAQWLGDGVDPRFDAQLEACLLHGDAGLPAHLLCYAPPPRWQAWLNARPGSQVRERERVRWSDAPTLPPAWTCAPLTAEAIAATDALGLHAGDRFWRSADDFLADGLGVGVFDARGTLVACAYAACVVHGVAEVDIAVAPAQRGRGLGIAVGRAFVEACLAAGILPTWDCFAANEASMRLAARLGFTPARRYPMLSFKVPLAAEPAGTRA